MVARGERSSCRPTWCAAEQRSLPARQRGTLASRRSSRLRDTFRCSMMATLIEADELENVVLPISIPIVEMTAAVLAAEHSRTIPLKDIHAWQVDRSRNLTSR